MKNAMRHLPGEPGHLPDPPSYLVFELFDSIAFVHAM